MKKFLNIAYILPILVFIIFLVGIFGCDNLGTPDIRKEFNKSDRPDYIGWKWNFGW